MYNLAHSQQHNPAFIVQDYSRNKTSKTAITSPDHVSDVPAHSPWSGSAERDPRECLNLPQTVASSNAGSPRNILSSSSGTGSSVSSPGESDQSVQIKHQSLLRPSSADEKRVESKNRRQTFEDKKSEPRGVRNGRNKPNSPHIGDSSESEAGSSGHFYNKSKEGSQDLAVGVPASLELVSQVQKQSWLQFEAHIKMIDDSAGLVTRQPIKTFRSSATFQTVMADMYGESEYGKSTCFSRLKSPTANIALYASRFLGKVKALNKRKNIEAKIPEKKDQNIYPPKKDISENARRGWKTLRLFVQEMAEDKHPRAPAPPLPVLHRTLESLTDLERTRYDLYQRYGILPRVLSDGTIVQENSMLSKRATPSVIKFSEPQVIRGFHTSPRTGKRNKLVNTPRSRQGLKCSQMSQEKEQK